jgi:RNA polymerase sigma-70 factor (ECF subfamily)
MDADKEFRALFESAYPHIRRYALHRGLSASDADDLVAATFEVAWCRFGEIPFAAPLPWLYAVAHNLWRNQVRAEHRRGALLNKLPTQVEVPPAAGEPAALEAEALSRGLAALSADDQEVLLLLAWDGLTPNEAAIVLGCTPSALRTRLRRARDRLAAQLGIDRPRLRRREVPQVGRQKTRDAIDG